VRLLVVYRCTPRENTKPRPEYYSKLICLQSFLRAVDACSPRPEVVFWADGELPEPLLGPMKAAGEVAAATRSGGGGSYLSAVDLALGRLDDGDLVYLAEDDYLYSEDAFTALSAAAGALPQASYFGLYASIVWHRTQGFDVDGTLWHTAESTTLSFAARSPALRADRRLHELALRVGTVPDTELCLAYQGHSPYPWRRLAAEALTDPPGASLEPRHRARRAGGRAWVNAIAWRRAFRPRLLVAPHPALATHVELPYLATGTDWEHVVRETAEWAAQRSGRAPG
jgi:hypothetical protein